MRRMERAEEEKLGIDECETLCMYVQMCIYDICVNVHMSFV